VTATHRNVASVGRGHDVALTGALVGGHPFGGFNMSGTDSKAGGFDYLMLFLQAKSIAKKV
jgi:1-pyrroline-5-carboxylate dehydrogenase